MFGDPCPGTLKYLEAHYQCMPAATTTATSRPSPPWLITSPPSVWNTAKSVTLRPPLKMSTSTERSTTIPLLVVNTSTTSSNSIGTQTSVPAAPPSEVEEALVPHSTSSLPPSALPPSWKTTHWLTTASWECTGQTAKQSQGEGCGNRGRI
ncbi:unnamed protein product, partial [Timema podura]|nr:unnamed protein product [Timema podura]